MPDMVGSVTINARSAPEMAEMTGQPIPGGPSTICKGVIFFQREQAGALFDQGDQLARNFPVQGSAGRETAAQKASQNGTRIRPAAGSSGSRPQGIGTYRTRSPHRQSGQWNMLNRHCDQEKAQLQNGTPRRSSRSPRKAPGRSPPQRHR
jgi:hypothetical protein